MSETGSPATEQISAPIGKTGETKILALPANIPDRSPVQLSVKTDQPQNLSTENNSSAANQTETSTTPPKSNSIPETVIVTTNEPAPKKAEQSPPRDNPTREHHDPLAAKPNKDPWAVLGLDRNATPDDIKSAFRRLSREYHPDVNKDNPQAEEIFKNISEAYNNIKDDEHRRKFESRLSACEQASDSDFSAAAETARATINIVGMEKVGRYVDSRITAAGKNPGSPEDVAGLLPEIIDPVAEAIANPDSGEIAKIISISSDELQVMRTLKDIFAKSRNPETSIALNAILELLIALILAMQIMQKAMAHGDWSEDFGQIITESSKSGKYARYLQLYVGYQKFLREQKELKQRLSVPALPASVPERQANAVSSAPVSENQNQPPQAEQPSRPSEIPPSPEQSPAVTAPLPPPTESSRLPEQVPPSPQLPATTGPENPVPQPALHEQFIAAAQSTKINVPAQNPTP